MSYFSPLKKLVRPSVPFPAFFAHLESPSTRRSSTSSKSTNHPHQPPPLPPRPPAPSPSLRATPPGRCSSRPSRRSQRRSSRRGPHRHLRPPTRPPQTSAATSPTCATSSPSRTAKSRKNRSWPPPSSCATRRRPNHQQSRPTRPRTRHCTRSRIRIRGSWSTRSPALASLRHRLGSPR